MSIATVLGIDPAISNTGLVVAQVNLETRKIVSILKTVLVKTEKDKDTKKKGKNKKRMSEDRIDRARKIASVIESLVHENEVEYIFSEIPEGTQSASSAIGNGVCVGILAYASLRTPLIQLSPLEVKELSTGDKWADKCDIIKWAYELYPDAGWLLSNRKNECALMCEGKYLTNENEHVADAIATIAAGLKKEKVLW